MTTIYLNPETWDLDIDATRSIALAADPYATAQTVANSARLWTGEAPYDTDRGIPYETDILGKSPTMQLVSSWYEREALTVPRVSSAIAVIEFDRSARSLSGQIQCTLDDGTIINV